MLVIGLTGGVGSGKSTAAAMFAELGAVVVDTDDIARELTAPGGAAMGAISETFGPDFVAPDGSLDRAKMRALAFGDESARRRLEAILHPLIRAESGSRVANAAASYVLLVVPLLFETGAYRGLVSRVLVVDCPEEEQMRRASRRPGITESDVRRIMAAQLARAERLVRADDVIVNHGNLDSLRRSVEALHTRYLALSRESP
ncbi:MAG: dephospho-CoA kinase [Burkholderiales bacterium]|nr:dephospho-CoA kinase [Burkholderiales bacterium]